MGDANIGDEVRRRARSRGRIRAWRLLNIRVEDERGDPLSFLNSKRGLNEKGGKKMPRRPKRGSRRKHVTEITIDDVLLSALERGPVTVNDILKHFERRVRIRLNKLRVRSVVMREGRGGALVSSPTNYYVQTVRRRRSARRAAVSRCRSDAGTASGRMIAASF